MRTKNSFLNFLTDVIPQFIMAILSFFRIKLFLVFIGTERLGVYQLFSQILPYISLAEMGLTNAVSFSLYKPLSENNKKKVSQIIVGAKSVFTKIMFFMIIVGLLISPVVNFLIADTSLSGVYISVAFIITMLSNVIGYYSTAYVVLFDSNQEKYKYNYIIQILLLIKQVIEIICIVVFKSLYVVLILEFIFALLRIVVTKKMFNKNYDYVDFNEKEDKSFITKTKELLPHKIGTIISKNIDVVITSKFLGLTSVVAYNSYYYIITVINNIIGKFSSATLASIGNLIIVDKERAYKVFLEYNSMLFYIASIICVPLLIVISPFVGLWYGNEFVVDEITVVLFILIMFYEIVRIVLNTFAGAAGIYKETLKCTYTEILMNLIISLVFVNKIGIKGLLMGTFSSMIVSEYFIKPKILNDIIFNNKVSKYYLQCIKLFTISIISLVLARYMYSFFVVTDLLHWFIYSFLIFIINLIIISLGYILLKENSFMFRVKTIFKKRKEC